MLHWKYVFHCFLKFPSAKITYKETQDYIDIKNNKYHINKEVGQCTVYGQKQLYVTYLCDLYHEMKNDETIEDFYKREEILLMKTTTTICMMNIMDLR